VRIKLFKEYNVDIQALIDNIIALKKERGAVILAHNYQIAEIQALADITGDSLALARAAVSVPEETIVFCGVRFMAESAAILNPSKKVLLPAKNAGCPLADMATPAAVERMREKHPDAAVVCYVNSSAEVKAVSDVCCTSGNAVKVVQNIKQDTIIFVPDKNLGAYVQKMVPEKNVILWDGFCLVHHNVTESEVLKARKEHPTAAIMAHPECPEHVLAHVDHIASTAGMFSYVQESSAEEFVVLTEKGMLWGLQEQNPTKKFYFPSPALRCRNMKLTTLQLVYDALEKDQYVISIDPDIAAKARVSLNKMLEYV